MIKTNKKTKNMNNILDLTGRIFIHKFIIGENKNA